MTEDLVAFLLARLAEREQAAKAMAAIYPEPWDLADRGWMVRVVADGPHFPVVTVLNQEQTPDDFTGFLSDVLQHLVLNGPTWVLADVESKRRVVELHAIRSGTGGTWDTDPPAICNEDNDLHPCGTLRCMGLSDAGHPAYLEEWRP